MKVFPNALNTRIARDEVVVRDYLWLGAKNRNTGETVERGFWSDNGSTVSQVTQPNGSVVSRQYANGSGMVSVSTVPLVVGLTAQPMTIEMSATDEAVLDVVKSFSVRRAPVQTHRGFWNPDTMRGDQPAIQRFFGFADEPEFTTAEAGGVSSIRISCAPHTQELLRTSERMRSDADQRRRDPNDGGFRHVDKPPRQLEWASE